MEAVAVSRQEVMVAWSEMVSLSLERSWIYLTNEKRGFPELEVTLKNTKLTINQR